MAGYLLVTWNYLQYTAPLVPVLMVILMRGFRSPRGRGAARMMPTVAIVLLVTCVGVAGAHPQVFEASAGTAPCCKLDQANLRYKINARLARIPGQDLVLVSSGPDNPVELEMVYNDADIDQSQVVWPHRLGAARDALLLEYFPDRVVWTFDWDRTDPQGFGITRYRAPGSEKPNGNGPADIGAGVAAEGSGLAHGLQYRPGTPVEQQTPERH